MSISSLTYQDLRYCHEALQDQISENMDLWSAGKCKDNELDAYIDRLCAVRDKVSKILIAEYQTVNN